MIFLLNNSFFSHTWKHVEWEELGAKAGDKESSLGMGEGGRLGWGGGGILCTEEEAVWRGRKDRMGKVKTRDEVFDEE